MDRVEWAMDSSATVDKNISGKVVVLGISGSIAAYKAADLTSELRKAGADVFVVMSESATGLSPLDSGDPFAKSGNNLILG